MIFRFFLPEAESFDSKTATKDLKTESSQNNTAQTAKPNVPILLQTQKSQRHIDHDEIEADLNVSKSMQDFVFKKMSKRIEDSIEFVEVAVKKGKKRKTSDTDGFVRLLKGTDPITQIDFLPESQQVLAFKRPKPELKRREIEPDNYDDEEKLKMVTVDGEQILKQTETKGWKSKKVKSNKLFNYQEKNGVSYLIEPKNEFTALRKKNNWSESKIANFSWKNHKAN